MVSPHRALRPWQGSVEARDTGIRESYDSACYLCPGNARASGGINPPYPSTYVFANDFPALLSEIPEGFCQDPRGRESAPDFIRATPERGECRVVCFSPQHDQTLSLLTPTQIVQVIETWREQTADLATRSWISHIMIFENKGEIMGCSNPHPHGQIWATESVPGIPARELKAQCEYLKQTGKNLLVEYALWEEARDERIIVSNDSWVAVVPFWATWPFETLVIPRRPCQFIHELSHAEIHDWAHLLKNLITGYDRLFSCSFPYSMGVYQAPINSDRREGFQLNQKFFPPLLRSADIKKHMVGFELFAESQRDITPETAAQRLRACVATPKASN